MRAHQAYPSVLPTIRQVSALSNNVLQSSVAPPEDLSIPMHNACAISGLIFLNAALSFQAIHLDMYGDKRFLPVQNGLNRINGPI